MQVLSDDQIEDIHQASLTILEEFGIELMSERGIEIFRRAGAKIDPGSQNVRLDRGLVAEALKTAPSIFTLTPRNPDRAVTIGGNNQVYVNVSSPPSCSDLDRGRRSGRVFCRRRMYWPRRICLVGVQIDD